MTLDELDGVAVAPDNHKVIGVELKNPRGG